MKMCVKTTLIDGDCPSCRVWLCYNWVSVLLCLGRATVLAELIWIVKIGCRHMGFQKHMHMQQMTMSSVLTQSHIQSLLTLPAEKGRVLLKLKVKRLQLSKSVKLPTVSFPSHANPYVRNVSPFIYNRVPRPLHGTRIFKGWSQKRK